MPTTTEVLYEDSERRVVLETTTDGDGALIATTERVEPKPGSEAFNAGALRERASDALASNSAFLALASPTNAQNAAQLKALTRQVNGLIRITLGQLDSTDGT